MIAAKKLKLISTRQRKSGRNWARPLRLILRHGKATLADVARIAARAATADLRGTEVYAWLRRAIGRPTDPHVQQALGLLDAWTRAGSQRRDLNGDNVDEDSPAIVLMDTWWPIAVRRMFEPALGGKLVTVTMGDEAVRSAASRVERRDEGGSTKISDSANHGTAQMTVRAANFS